MLPPRPSLGEMAGDAWHELAGYDGRFARTIRLLLLHPGGLTREVIAGRRNRYISPVRLYLFASFLFFLTAAFAPPLATRGGGLRAGISADGQEHVIELDAVELISPEDRAAGLKQLEDAPWWADMMLRPILTDPAGFRARLIENTPRVLFALVPLFAGAVALFFSGGWLQHTVFSLHVHAAVFLLLVPRELAKFTRNVYAFGTVEVLTVIAATAYVVMAAKRVYAERWPWLLLKALPVAVVYLLAYAVAMVIALALTATL